MQVVFLKLKVLLMQVDLCPKHYAISVSAEDKQFFLFLLKERILIFGTQV